MEEIIKSLRKEAIYFKLTSKSKYGTAVNINDVIKTLKCLSDSYLAFVAAEYEKINIITDSKKSKKIISGLSEENNLMVVDLKFESCGMAVSPDLETYSFDIPKITEPLNWKSKIFNSYKTNILCANFDDENYLNVLSEKYSATNRQKIFKPLFDGIIKNENAKIVFGIGEPKYNIKLTLPTQMHYERIISDDVLNKKDSKDDTFKTSIAKVEIRSGKLNYRPKVLELFEEIENVILPLSELLADKMTYKFKYPLYCELISDTNSNYLLENKQLGIYATGNSLQEAKNSFALEFDYIFKRYNSLKDNELTKDVLDIRNYINAILEK